MIEVVKFEKFHVKHLPPISPALVRLYLTCTENWTILSDDVPVAAGGILINEGIGTSWGLVSERARALPKALHKYTKTIIDGIIERHQLRRVDVIVDPEKPRNVAWVKRLGYHYEGPMCDFYAVGKPAEYWARTTSKCEVSR